MEASDLPAEWWGPRWVTPRRRTILELIAEGTVSVEVAALLWARLARRPAVIVGAGPSGAGKTTLLTALLDFIPPAVRRIPVRGRHDPLATLRDTPVRPAQTVLLVNEMSAHLPTYLWGPAVHRVFEAAAAGFGLVATVHATTVEELIGSLCGAPLRVPPAAVAAAGLLVTLEAGRVSAVVDLALLPNDISPEAPVRHHFHPHPYPPERERAQRAAVLTQLLAAAPPPERLAARLAALNARWLAPSPSSTLPATHGQPQHGGPRSLPDSVLTV